MDKRKQTNEKDTDFKEIRFDLMFPDKYQIFGMEMQEAEIIKLRESKMSDIEEPKHNIELKCREEDYVDYDCCEESDDKDWPIERKKERKGKSKDIKLDNKLIKYFFEDGMQADYAFKDYFYQQYDSINKDSLLGMAQIYKKYGDRTNNYAIGCIYQSKLMNIFNYDVRHVQLLTDDIIYNPRVCLFLANNELFSKFKSLDDMPPNISSFIRKAYNADKNKLPEIICSLEEAEEFWNKIFEDDIVHIYLYWLFKRERKPDKKIIIDYIKNKKEEQLEDNENQNKDQEKLEVMNSLSEIKKYKKLKLKVADYLSFFIYAMSKIKNYNPMMTTQPLGYIKPYIKEKISNSVLLNDKEKEMAKICYEIIGCQEKTDGCFKIEENYYKFVIAYLKLCGKKCSSGEKEILKNIYLFESVFGFAFIENVTDKIQEELLLSQKKFKYLYMSSERFKFEKLIEDIFVEGDVLTRIDFAKYIVQMIFRGKNIKKKLKKGMDLWNDFLNYAEEKKNFTDEKKIEDYDIEEIPQLMPYLKIIKKDKSNKGLSVRLRNINVEDISYGENEERIKIRRWLLCRINWVYWEPELYDFSYTLR